MGAGIGNIADYLSQSGGGADVASGIPGLGDIGSIFDLASGDYGEGAGSLVGSILGSIIPGIGTLLGGLGGGAIGDLIQGLIGSGVPTTAKTSGVANDLSGSSNPENELLGQFMNSQGVNNNNVLSNPAFASKTNRMADLIEALSGQQLPNFKPMGSTGEITGFKGPGFSTPANIMGVESAPQAIGSIFGTPGASPNLTPAQIAQLMPQLSQIAAGGGQITAAQLKPLLASVSGTGVGDVNDYLNQPSTPGGGNTSETAGSSTLNLGDLANLIPGLIPLLNLFGGSGGSGSNSDTTNSSTTNNIFNALSGGGAAIAYPRVTAPTFTPFKPAALPMA